MFEKKIKLQNFNIGNEEKFTLIAGPCVIESENHAMEHAEEILKISKSLSINFIFKSSFDKANRTSINSNRGVGQELGIDILQKIKNRFEIPVTTDIHEIHQCELVSEVVDIRVFRGQ